MPESPQPAGDGAIDGAIYTLNISTNIDRYKRCDPMIPVGSDSR